MDPKRPEQDSRSKDFFRLFMANQKSIYAFILAMVHNCQDADDIMQETTTLMWQRFNDFKSDTNFGAWGTQIARFKVLQHYRSKSRLPEMFDKDLMDQISSCTRKKINEIKPRLDALQECLKKLNESDKKLISIKYDQNVKITELAKRMDRPVQGLYKAIARIHNLLHGCVNRVLKRWEHQV